MSCSKVRIDVQDGIYPPSEDSILMLEATKYAHGDVLDMCAGSGVIGLNAAERARHVTLVDINRKAVDAIENNAAVNRIENVTAIVSDLFKKLDGKRFDVIYCNPPYLPGSAMKKDWLDTAIVGGSKGYEITTRILKDMKRHMTRGGTAFMILSTVYDIDKIYKLLRSLEFSFKKIKTIEFFFEELILIKIYEKRRSSNLQRPDSASSNNRRKRAYIQA